MFINLYYTLYYVLLFCVLILFFNAFIFSGRNNKNTYIKIVYSILLGYLSIILFINNALFSLECNHNNIFYTNELLFLILLLPTLICFINYKFKLFKPNINFINKLLLFGIIIVLKIFITLYYFIFNKNYCSTSNDFIIEWGFMKTNKIFIYIFTTLYLLSFYIVNSNLLIKENINFSLFTIVFSFIVSFIFYRWDWIYIFCYILLLCYIIKLIINSIFLIKNS